MATGKVDVQVRNSSAAEDTGKIDVQVTNSLTTLATGKVYVQVRNSLTTVTIKCIFIFILKRTFKLYLNIYSTVLIIN